MKTLAYITVAVILGATTSAHAAGATAPSSAFVFKPVTITSVVNISSGNVKTQGNNASGTVTMPATFPLQATPAPSYTGGWAKNGNNADAGTAARVNLSGQPGAPFQLVLAGWQYVSGDHPTSMTAPTYYSPSNSPTTSPHGVFNAAGTATIYIGATFTIPRDNNGTTVVMRPQFTIVYD